MKPPFVAWESLYSAYTKHPTPNMDFNTAAIVLARAISLGCWVEADRIANIIRGGLTERRKVGGRQQPICAFDAIHVTRVAPFVLNLYAQWTGKPFPLEGLPVISMEAYEPLLSLWQTEDLTALEQALFVACDLHMERSKLSQVESFEFIDEVDILHPAEILAVLRLREAKGLANPAIDHPLMQTPVGRLFEIKSVPHEEVLERAVANFLATIPSPASQG